MSNVAPMTVTLSYPTGPGQTTSSLKFTDVNAIEFDSVKNTVKLTRAGAGGISYYDYSAGTTITATITSGITTWTLT